MNRFLLFFLLLSTINMKGVLATRLDRAIGFSDKGDLHNITGNWGMLSQVHFFCPAMHWPRSAPFQHQYCYGLLFFVGNEDNVVMPHSRWTNLISDWEPMEGSLGNLHSGELASGWDMSFWGGEWPEMATSDNESTWPKNYKGKPFWPGPWRRDPDTGEVVQGEFVSDKDLYCCFDDRLNPKGVLGLEVHMSAYSYGRAYAQDILFYRFDLVNTSTSTLQGLYTGVLLAIRVDFDMQDLLELVDAHPDDGDSRPNFVYVWDADGEPENPWVSLGMMGVALVESPFDLGLTDFHYFEKLFDPTTDEKIWPIISSDPTDPDINPQYYFHGPDVHLDQTPPSSAKPWDWIISSGPFDMAPGETTSVAIAVLAGNDSTDLMENAKTAFKMKEKYYQGPKPPPAPVVYAVPDNRLVRLWWDAEPSETTPDDFTGEFDFEGYKIYRSDDQGMTWGKEITDQDGQVVGYVPLAIFDLVDGIKGPDPAFQYQSLGNDIGLRHSFIDSAVINGVEYWYCVTAYDKGNQDPAELEASLETGKGTPRDPYVVFVRPGNRPEGWVPGYLLEGDTLMNILDWHCDGLVIVDVLDPSLIIGHTYELFFDTTELGNTVFTLIDVTENKTLFLHQNLPDSESPDGLPVKHGFRLILKNVEPGIKNIQWTKVRQDTSTFDWFTEDRGRGHALRFGYDDFQITIDRSAQTMAPVFGYVVDSTVDPIVRDTFYVPVQAELVTNQEQPVPVFRIIVIDPWYYFPDTTCFSQPGWNLAPGGTAWNPNGGWGDEWPDELGLYYYYLDPVTQETLSVSAVHVRTQNGPETAIAPSNGDQFLIDVYTPFFHPIKGGARYRFTTVAPYVDENKVDLSKIKVVPNPYIVQAGWETTSYGHMIMFTHLPQECTIRIYNISGEHIATIDHNNDTGYEFWNLRSKHGLAVAYGLYVYLIKTPKGEEQVGKFAIIK